MGILVANIYLLVIALGLCVLYTSLLWFFPYFFGKPSAVKQAFSLRSIAYLLALYTFVIWIVFSMEDIELGNRILHSVAGGFAAFMTCFLAVRDTRLPLSRLRFFIFSALLVTSLGVVNELAELILSFFVEFDFPRHIDDTWFDLASNTVGLLVAALVFTPFIKSDAVDSPAKF